MGFPFAMFASEGLIAIAGATPEQKVAQLSQSIEFSWWTNLNLEVAPTSRPIPYCNVLKLAFSLAPSQLLSTASDMP
jgi:hypothetical protein